MAGGENFDYDAAALGDWNPARFTPDTPLAGLGTAYGRNFWKPNPYTQQDTSRFLPAGWNYRQAPLADGRTPVSAYDLWNIVNEGGTGVPAGGLEEIIRSSQGRIQPMAGFKDMYTMPYMGPTAPTLGELVVPALLSAFAGGAIGLAGAAGGAGGALEGLSAQIPGEFGFGAGLEGAGTSVLGAGAVGTGGGMFGEMGLGVGELGGTAIPGVGSATYGGMTGLTAAPGTLADYLSPNMTGEGGTGGTEGVGPNAGNPAAPAGPAVTPGPSVPPGSSTALSRILGQLQGGADASAADWMSVLGSAGSTALGLFGANQQANAAGELSGKYWDAGAPSRARFEASMTPGFDPMSIPGYSGALKTSMDSQLAGLSATGGNPWGQPGGLVQAQANVMNRTAMPAIDAYQRLNQSGGQLGFSQAANFDTAGMGANANMYNALGYGLNQLTQPDNPYTGLMKILNEQGYLNKPV